LEFFGIPWEASPAAETARGGEFCVLASAADLAEAIAGAGDPSSKVERQLGKASSVYLYDFQDTHVCRQLLRLLTGDPQADIRKLSGPRASISVTRDFPRMSGPMSGLRVPIDLGPTGGLFFHITHEGEGFQSILAVDQGHVFLKVRWRGVQVYLNVSHGIVDLSSPSQTYFDVRKAFGDAVPIAMYLKWAFHDDCWASPETSACLIVDDPLLTPRYGFLHFRDTLELMDSHSFTTAIAFIPWNWRRTNPRTAAIFRQRPDRFSLCVHGCDHTNREFAARSTEALNGRIKSAIRRMDALSQTTSIPYDRVMVFPQGAFSPETGRALKLNGFVAAVNTEVSPWDGEGNETTIGDLWNVATMKYGTFPIFTRRYPAHGVANAAFDALLGKPCMIVEHHEAFRQHGSDLVNYIAELNSLNWNLRWRSLGDAIRRSYKVRSEADGTKVVHLFANRLVLDNPSDAPQELLFLKQEADPECLKAVMVNGRGIAFSCADGYLQFAVTLAPRQTAEVHIGYFDSLPAPLGKDTLAYLLHAGARRYASELRDNYLSQSALLSRSAARLRSLFK
jgi:hypothetical protein